MFYLDAVVLESDAIVVFGIDFDLTWSNCLKAGSLSNVSNKVPSAIWPHKHWKNNTFRQQLDFKLRFTIKLRFSSSYPLQVSLSSQPISTHVCSCMFPVYTEDRISTAFSAFLRIHRTHPVPRQLVSSPFAQEGARKLICIGHMVGESECHLERTLT